jgi:hypothetical protein
MKGPDAGLAVADLMLGLAGVMVLVLVLAISQSRAAAPPVAQDQIWLAMADGLVLGDGRRIGLDALAQGQVPVPGQGVPVLVVVADGLETAFLAELAAARAGWSRIEIRRLTGACHLAGGDQIAAALACLR